MARKNAITKNLRLSRITVERVQKFADEDNRSFNNAAETMLIREFEFIERFGKHSWE